MHLLRLLTAGLATIAALVQRSGGTVQHPAQALDETLEQMAANIESVATADATALGRPIPPRAPFLLHQIHIPCSQPKLFSRPASDAVGVVKVL